MDCDWRILLFKSEASRHFRVAADDVLGCVLWDAFPGSRETGLGQLFLKTMVNRDTVSPETESVVFPGRWLAYRLFPLGDGIGVVFRDTTDRRSAERQRDLVINELGHRIKNTLALAQSIASQTFADGSVEPEARRAFENRLQALGNAHAILTKRTWDSADLHEVLGAAIQPHTAPGRDAFKLDGPMLRLGPKSAVALAMAVHELYTIASKYGALSTNGNVDLIWTINDGRLRLRWSERGGPPVVDPLHRGFGTLMIEKALGSSAEGPREARLQSGRAKLLDRRSSGRHKRDLSGSLRLRARSRSLTKSCRTDRACAAIAGSIWDPRWHPFRAIALGARAPTPCRHAGYSTSA